MDMRVPRASSAAALVAALLLLLAWHAVPARAASIDPELVAESVTEDGYYVDSGASYLKSDADLDRLRAALEQAGRAGVVVLPAGSASGPVISRLLATPNHKATYVVLTGTRLQAVSNAYTRSTVNKLVARASTAATPGSKVLSFLSLLNPKHRAAAAAKQKGGTLPAPSQTGAAAAQHLSRAGRGEEEHLRRQRHAVRCRRRRDHHRRGRWRLLPVAPQEAGPHGPARPR